MLQAFRMDRHGEKVARIASQLRAHDSSRPLSLHKRSVSHQVPKAGDLRRFDDKIDVADLTDVLRIDPDERVCVAESGVTFVDLVAKTMEHGLVPMVVPELKTITIGGAVSGCSLESSSFRHGGFHDTCLEYEVITARGEVLTCRPDGDRGLLFQMMHGTFGTLGILSKLTFRLMPAKPFVRVRYEKHPTFEAYLAAIDRRFHAADVDYMDGIVHSPSEHVLALGELVDEAPYTNRYDWTKVYYRSTRERDEDYLRTPDYFFRYDHGVTNVHPRSALGRLLFGRLMGSTNLLRLADKFRWALPAQHPTVILDVFIPFSKTAEFMDWYRREIDYFPLWCVPYWRVRPYEWLSADFLRCTNDELYLDLAIYGMKQPSGRNVHALMEKKLLEVGGFKTLISHNYYSEDDFWKTWNRGNYDAVKAMVDPDNVLRGLYEKTCRTAMGRG
jgi:FAD/FMN-containing dehydrogenase